LLSVATQRTNSCGPFGGRRSGHAAPHRDQRLERELVLGAEGDAGIAGEPAVAREPAVGLLLALDVLGLVIDERAGHAALDHDLVAADLQLIRALPASGGEEPVIGRAAQLLPVRELDVHRLALADLRDQRRTEHDLVARVHRGRHQHALPGLLAREEIRDRLQAAVRGHAGLGCEAGLVRPERLLAAGIRGPHLEHVRRLIVAVDLVDEDQPGLARLPGLLDDQVPELLDRPVVAGRIEARGVIGGVIALLQQPHLAGLRIHHAMRFLGRVVQPAHELVRHGDGQVVVGDLAQVFLEADEADHVRVIDPHHAHVRAAPEGALLDRVGHRGEHLQEREGPLGGAAGAAHDGAARPQAGEIDACAPAGALHECNLPGGLHDVGDRVFQRQHEAGGQHAQPAPRVHEGGRVGDELAADHQVVVGILDGGDLRGRGAPLALDGGDGVRHAPEQLLRSLDHPTGIVPVEVAILEDRERVLGELDLGPFAAVRHNALPGLVPRRLQHHESPPP
jgi:hypothetical protein